MFKKYFLTTVLLLSLTMSTTVARTTHAAGAITMLNNGTTLVRFLIASSATPSNFAVFVSTFTNIAGAADLAKVTYNGINPTAGRINSSSQIQFDFPIAMGTAKSGGTFDILANTYVDSTATPNSTMNLADGQITDSAYPIITALSIASDGISSGYAKAGDTVTVTFDTTEDLLTDENMELYFSIDGNPTFDDSYYGTFTNTSGNTWEFSFVVNQDDAEGRVEFLILLEDLGGQQDIEYYTEAEITDESSVVVDLTAPVIDEYTPVTTPTTDISPTYEFESDEDGTISYGGSCASADTEAFADINTISFAELPNGTYSNCTITVTDFAGNDSNTITVSEFTVVSDAPALTLSATESGYAYSSPLHMTARFSEDVSGFAAGDISVSNGTVSNFVSSSASLYTFDVTPAHTGRVTITVPEGAVMDSNTNPNPFTEFGINYQGSSSSAGSGYATSANQIPTSTGGNITPTQPATEIPSTTCSPYLTTTLQLGDRNDSVTKLQMFLASQGFFTYPSFTTFFGPITFQAVKDFQLKYAADILAPIGLITPTGFVGQMTVGKINKISCPN